jgi:NAD+ synthase (glutamine-hydrolysing)
MRIALAQVNPVVGDVAGNTRLVIDAVARAATQGADLVLLPELVITGYPPEDLLHKAHFVEENIRALGIVAAAAETTVLLGFVDREEQSLFNAAALVRDGRVERVYRKRHLPNYGVFDERRYFVAGDDASLLAFDGVTVAPTVCEDVWVPDLASGVAGDGARIILNISASPYHSGKGGEREEMLRSRARDNGVWLAYCNLVGGQDELVFDGRSVVIAPDGEVIARAASFSEEILVVDVDPTAETAAATHLTAAPGPEGETYEALVLGLRDYVRKNGFRDVTLGLSGGIDSALTAAIAVDALGAEHVHGVLMPGRYSSAGSVTDARALAEALGIEALDLSIESAFTALLDTLAPVFEGHQPDVAEENLQARVRGTLLMALSNKFGWMVLATGNKSEISVGYSTLYGDMAGGFSPIKDVFKTRVYELARWRNTRGEVIPAETIDKPPSAELRPDQIDEDSLPPYDELDAILLGYIERDEGVEAIISSGHDRETTERVVRLVDGAEYKRRQSAPGTKITPKAFGKDRRMPLTNRYRG